jgi:hypothetical protein
LLREFTEKFGLTIVGPDTNPKFLRSGSNIHLGDTFPKTMRSLDGFAKSMGVKDGKKVDFTHFSDSPFGYSKKWYE